MVLTNTINDNPNNCGYNWQLDFYFIVVSLLEKAGYWYNKTFLMDTWIYKVKSCSNTALSLLLFKIKRLVFSSVPNVIFFFVTL